MNQHQVVDRGEWLAARRELLREEKEATRLRDVLAAKRRALPWVKVDRDYVFEGAQGPVPLANLFEDHSQLLIYHFMFAPDWTQGCKSCSMMADHVDPSVIHLRHRDTALAAVSRASIGQILEFQRRMGWTFPWVSSGANSFNQDFGTFFAAGEREQGLAIYNYDKPAPPLSDLPGLTAFARDSYGNIFHTYSTYARGLDLFLNVYNLLDVTAKGRDEAGTTNMAWLRHRDRYGVPGFLDPWVEAALRASA